MTPLRTHRKEAGLTQAELALRAGVSRQLVGAVESGRHLPRVDAAMALASALGVEVGTLFSPVPAACDLLTGEAPANGTLVRAGRVGDLIVTSPLRIGPEGWDVADGVVNAGTVAPFGSRRGGFAVAGCEPGLEVVERLQRERGMGAIAVSTSSRVAIAALVAGRVHAAVVHGPAIGENVPRLGGGVGRFRLTSWQVGLAAPIDSETDWWVEALAGQRAVIQREDGAAVQRTFEAATQTGSPIPGPRVGSHLQAASRAALTGMPAVTIEPAALAVGTVFHPIEVHTAELWVANEWLGDSAVKEALDLISGKRFQHRLLAIGGYDLAGCGTRVA